VLIIVEERLNQISATRGNLLFSKCCLKKTVYLPQHICRLQNKKESQWSLLFVVTFLITT